MSALTLVLIGLFTGVLGAMLGLGGSIILIPCLTLFFGIQQHLYQAAAMVVNFFVSALASWQHARAGVMVPAVIRAVIPTSIAAVALGVGLSELELFHGPRQNYLSALFGGFLLLVAAYNVIGFFIKKRNEVHPSRASDVSTVRCILNVGLPTGLVAGLLGVGGGLIAVPMQQLSLRLPLRSAIGNSAAIVCGLSVFGAALKNYFFSTTLHPSTELGPVQLSLYLIPGVVLGSFFGSRLTHLLPLAAVRIALIGVLVGGGILQMYHSLH